MISQELTKYIQGVVYFYTLKSKKNEKNILLEMLSDACIDFGNGTCVYGISPLFNS